MNPEQQLRHAAEQMDRATASLTPPPLAAVHRSARMRTIGVSVAAAIGVAVLIGGVVLALRPSGLTTLEPAGPTETTSASNDVVLVPDLDPGPEFDLGPNAVAVPLGAIDSGDQAADIALLRGDVQAVPFAGPVEVLALGRSDDRNVYVFRGQFIDEFGPAYEDTGECMVTRTLEGWEGRSCNDTGLRGLSPRVTVLGDIVTFELSGRTPEGASVVVLEIGEDRYWQQTQDGYAYLSVPASADQRARYLVYDSRGTVLEGTTIYTGVGPGDAATQTTAAVTGPDDGTCSGARVFPDIETEALPEPVVQTLGKITLFGSRCWFQELAGVSAEMFTASFGGMDPVELWTFEEEEGYEPMRFLMQILDMPYGTTQVDGRVLYIWPAAAAHDGDWTTVPAEDKEALRSLYDDDDFAGFDSFGAYIGYRTGIYEDGDWSFFVAGD